MAAASDILFREKRWAAALEYFTQLAQTAALPVNVLAGQVGQMRCLTELQRTSEAAAAAKKVIANDDANADLKAQAGFAVGQGSPRLAYRVLCDEHEISRRDIRSAYRRHR